MKLTKDSTGTITSTGIINNYRPPAFIQSDVNLTHYVHISKTHEAYRVGAEINVMNALNQHAIMAYYDTPITSSGSIGVPVTVNLTGVDYHALMTGFDYLPLMNGTVPGSTANSPKTLSNQYGLPNTFQAARQIRLKVAFYF